MDYVYQYQYVYNLLFFAMISMFFCDLAHLSLPRMNAREETRIANLFNFLYSF